MGKSASFSLERETLAGNPQAPITLVVFACARCPFCKVIVPSLYQEITQGPSRDGSPSISNPFPSRAIRVPSKEVGLGCRRAARSLWPFALEQYKHFDEFCPHKLTDWAVLSGMTKETFERTSQDPLTRTTLVAFKQEGLRHQIKATPTLFINGREYVYEMSEAAILDVLRELVDALPSHPAP
jgi:protein-disulfide isomerase